MLAPERASFCRSFPVPHPGARLQVTAVISLLLLPLIAACDDGSVTGAVEPPATANVKQTLISNPGAAQDDDGNRVLDKAGIIPSADEARINAILRDMEKKSGHQLFVATTPSLEGETIQEYSLRWGRQLKVGRKDYDDGAFLLLAPNENRIWVQLGYGLECRIPVDRGQAIVTSMTSQIDKKQYLAAIDAGVAGMVRELYAIPNDTRASAREARLRRPSDPSPCD